MALSFLPHPPYPTFAPGNVSVIALILLAGLGTGQLFRRVLLCPASAATCWLVSYRQPRGAANSVWLRERVAQSKSLGDVVRWAAGQCMQGAAGSDPG